MRFNINLASQPYQDVQRFFFRWALGLLGLAVLTGGLIYAATSAYLSWRVTEKQVAELRRQIAERDRQRATAEDFLNRPENRDARDRSQFLNALIARKAFSWTEIFNDLERLMPPRLRVLDIRPVVNDNNQLELQLAVTGSSRDSAIELVRRLEQSPHFSSAKVDAESLQPASQSQPASVQFQISAVYLPAFARRESSAGEQNAAIGVSAISEAKKQPEITTRTEARNGGH
jgi:type IV pilus assembly protein PilN